MKVVNLMFIYTTGSTSRNAMAVGENLNFNDTLRNEELSLMTTLTEASSEYIKDLYIADGNKKIIKHQDFYLPIVKISPTTVEIVTNYSKMTIQRVENKSTSSIESSKSTSRDGFNFCPFSISSMVLFNAFLTVSKLAFFSLKAKPAANW